jgi:hypothetical protein
MLSGYERTFNQADFERRLRHYFSDSAPCVIHYRLGLDFIEVEDAEREGSSIRIQLDPNASEEDNIRVIIEAVEDSLYPVVSETVEETDPVTPEEVFKKMERGVSLVDAMASAKKHIIKKEYRIVRIGLNNNTLVLKHDSVKKIYELLYIPVLKFLELLSNGKLTADGGYDYLVKNSSLRDYEQ